MNKSSSGYAVALSITFLSAAIVYFAQQLSALDNAAKSLAVYQDSMPGLIEEIASIRAEVPEVLAESKAIRLALPEILAEVKAVRSETVPALISETKALRTTVIPDLLNESSALRKNTIPNILKESTALRENTIPDILKESSALREKTIPDLLKEVKISREEMPALLDQANEIARSAGKNASEGAVSGFFTGVIRAPVNIVSSVGGSVFKGKALSSDDHQRISEATHKVLLADFLHAKETWENNKSLHHGDVIITSMSVNGDDLCRTLTLSAFKRKQSLAKSKLNVCRNSSGIWTELK